MFTLKFWKDTIERTVATMAQFLIVLGGADGAGFLNMEVQQLIVLTLLGGLAAILKALAATTYGSSTSASLVK